MESFWLVVGHKHANEPLYSTKFEEFLNYLGTTVSQEKLCYIEQFA